jgi:protein-L-isoaspartate(D-aspartate) O-methyltransferase
MKNLAKLKIRNVHFKNADGRQGWREYAPFERIIVTAASESIPPALQDQLAENGRMIIPIGRQYWSQDLVLVQKKNRRISTKKILPVRFVPLVNSKNKQ